MIAGNIISETKLMLISGLLVSGIVVLQAKSQTAAQIGTSTQAQVKAGAVPFRNQPIRMAKRATMYYESVWGVDDLIVRWAESGELVRFSYRITDATKAKALNDKKAEPILIDPQAGVKLVVPVMEKVGALRQSSTPETGKSYWMAFSNSGRRVKRGDHVDVVIGQFRAQGLVVD